MADGKESRSETLKAGRVDAQVFSDFIQRTSDFAIFALEPDGTIASWNPGAERIKGWAKDEIIGKNFSIFYTRADIAENRPSYVLRRAAHEGRFEDEGWRVRKDGSMFWANVVVTALRSADGELRGFMKVTRDLTDRKHEEEALREREERLRLLIEGVKDYAIFILDTKGHVRSWNQGAQRLKGYAPEEIIGKHFSVFYTPPDIERDHPAEELATALDEGRYEEEGWRVRKDGSTFWASVTITPLHDSRGRHFGFAKVTRDLSERKIAEERLRQRADSYAELNRELDAFSHSVAHDLRAPARAIIHLSDTLLGSGRLEGEDREIAESIHESSLRMGQLIKDLLDLSLSARQEPSRDEVDLSLVAERAAAEKRAHYRHRKIDFRIQPGLRARGDARLLQIVLTNLFDNAIKFTPDDPVVVEFGRDGESEPARYYVRDKGVGFDPRQADRLFHPFSRLGNAPATPGTGIGLTIVSRIIRRHGGEVSAKSAPGEGAEFAFTLDGRDLPPK